MAKSLGHSRRGRPQSNLRKFVVEIAPKIVPSTTDKEFTIVVGKMKNGKPDSYTEKLPNNSVLIPAEFLVGKSQATAYEVARLGRKESGKKFSIETCKYLANDGTEGYSMYLYVDNRPKKSDSVAPKVAPKKSPAKRPQNRAAKK